MASRSGVGRQLPAAFRPPDDPLVGHPLEQFGDDLPGRVDVPAEFADRLGFRADARQDVGVDATLRAGAYGLGDPIEDVAEPALHPSLGEREFVLELL